MKNKDDAYDNNKIKTILCTKHMNQQKQTDRDVC